MSTGATRSRKTIGQLARTLDVDAREVSRVARRILGLSAGSARDVNYVLTPHEWGRIAEQFGSLPAPDSEPTETPNSAAPTEEGGSLCLVDDPPAPLDGLQFGKLNHGLWVHPDVPDTLDEQGALRKRLGLVLQHLGAHGRTSVVKGCRDDTNKGWLRSPLGGNHGMQFYLWWAPYGSRPIKQISVPEGDILVRAVRHHDDHDPLIAGELDDYLPFGQREIEDEALVGRPWTDEQLEFVQAHDPVRIVLGRPGSGKTTVLWRAVEARGAQRVLYLTWSRELTRYAQEHFAAFAPSDVQVDARDFVSFLSEICRTDIRRLTLQQSQSAFLHASRLLQPNVLGPWVGREAALFAELRAFLLGRALPGESGCVKDAGVVRLDDTAYTEQRGGSGGVGRAAAASLLKTLRALDAGLFDDIFPELAAAERAIGRLRRDEVPDGFLEFDRVVVDEVQDLTLREAAVVVEFCRAVARARGRAPWLLVAGDDGQTVRPSGFEWGPFNDLIARRIGTPRKFQLEENLRCPAGIAGVIERASERYSHLDKERRPTKQRHLAGGQHVDARLFHVDARSEAEGVELLDQLEDVDGVVILTPRNEAPTWVPAHLQDLVLTPADAKGLEYQSVILLDPGKLLSLLEPSANATDFIELEDHARRTTIDQLRVALSRATETLAFVDVQATDVELRLSRELLGTPVPFYPEDIDQLRAPPSRAPETLAFVDVQATDAELTPSREILGTPVPLGSEDSVESFSDANAEDRVLAQTRNTRAQSDERPPNEKVADVDVQATDVELSLSRELLGAPAPLGSEEFVDNFIDVDATPEERVLAQTRDARALIDERPRRAWRRAWRAYQATRQLGDPSLSVQGEVHRTLLATAVRLLIDGVPEGVSRSDVVDAVEEALASSMHPSDADAFRELERWSVTRTAPPFDLLAAVLRVGNDGDWIRPALAGVALELRKQIEAGTTDPTRARDFAGDVGGWLALTGFAGDAAEEARSLRLRAIDTLLAAREFGDAEAVLAEVRPPDGVRTARLREGQGRHEEAAEAFASAEAQVDALRNWRLAGRWERALPLAGEDDATRTVLVWLQEVAKVLHDRPRGHASRITPGEAKRLHGLLSAAEESKPNDEKDSGRASSNLVMYRAGNIEIPMVRLPPGVFLMGSPPSDSEAEVDEQPQHWVRLTRGFELGVTPVTNAQWKAVMGTAPPSEWKEPNCPVTNVSAIDAERFCAELSRSAGVAAFRLPTEAEWEYACRAGSDSPRYGALDEIAWYADNSGGRTQDVGGKLANAWGLHDMLGNVWEWTSDTGYRAYREASRSAPIVDPTDATGSDRVDRGGSWFDFALFARAGYRGNGFDPGFSNHFLGFRIARTVP